MKNDSGQHILLVNESVHAFVFLLFPLVFLSIFVLPSFSFHDLRVLERQDEASDGS